VFEKQPGDTLDYDADFTNWLPDGDTFTMATATFVGLNPIALDNPNEAISILSVSYSTTNPVVKVWVEGGKDGATYKVTVTVSTGGGRVKETDFRIRVREK